jgi:hypothetical protein
MGDYFGYNPGDVPAEAFKISPSQLSRFFDETGAWVREFLLGEPGFDGNTASYLGSTVHGLAAMYKDKGEASFTEAEAFIRSIETEGVDKDYIRQQFPPMYLALERNFLVSAVGTPELFLKQQIAPNVYVGGSIDLLNSEEVVDYKTTSALNAPDSVKRSYYFQQLCYVWMARQAGYPVKRFRLVYVTTNVVGRISEKTGKPMQDYPTKVTSVVHEVTNEDMELIEGVLKLVADFVTTWNKYPELRHVLAQDYRLKETLPRVSIFSKKEVKE